MKFFIPIISLASYLIVYFAITLTKPPTQDPIFLMAQKAQIHLRPIMKQITQQSQQKATNQSRCLESVSSSLCQDRFEQSFLTEKDGFAQKQTLIVDQLTKFWGRIKLDSCFNLFENKNCDKQQILAKIIQGLSTGMLSKKINNKDIYNSSILSNPDRFNNLLYVYQLVAKAAKQTLPVWQKTNSDTYQKQSSIIQDQLIYLFNNTEVTFRNRDTLMFFWQSVSQQNIFELYTESLYKEIPFLPTSVQQDAEIYLKGFRDSSTILSEAQPSIDQAKGTFYLFNSLNEAVLKFYSHRSQVELQHMSAPFSAGTLATFVAGLIFVIALILKQINVGRKVKKQFRHSFPKNARSMKIE